MEMHASPFICHETWNEQCPRRYELSHKFHAICTCSAECTGAYKGVMSHHHSLTVANFRDGDLVDDAPVEPVGGRRVALHRRVQPLAGREQRRVVSVRRDGLVGKGR